LDSTFTVSLGMGGAICREIGASDRALVVWVTPEAEADSYSLAWDASDLGVIDEFLMDARRSALTDAGMAEWTVAKWPDLDGVPPTLDVSVIEAAE
jgi:hypothetical protein